MSLMGMPTGLHKTLMRGAWSPAVDEYLSEWLFIQPMRRDGPNAQATPDPSREGFTVAGVFRAPREPIEFGQAESNKQAIMLDKPTFSIALAALPIALRRGDCIVRLESRTWYEIRAAKTDPLKVRGLFEVVECGAPDGLGGEVGA